MKIINQEKFKQLPDSIFFDMDNTFYNYDSAHNEAMNAIRNKIVNRFGINDRDFNNAFSEARKIIKTQLGDVASSHSRLLYFEKMFEIIGLKSQVLLSLELERTYWRIFLKNAILFDGIKTLLDDIRILGIPMVIVTDLTAQIQFKKIIYFNLDGYFDFIVTSEESGSDKPHPPSFELAMKKIQLKSNHIWMIGDNPKNDIYGARSSIGAICIQKIHNGIEIGEGFEEPDAYFEKFSELQILLKKIKQNLK
tara:strand:+ start:1 stop:753 length:753 start_codon:yes stop_codon:yes gene_type:complete